MPEPLVDGGRAGLAQLAAKWGLTWDNLMRARSDAEAERRRLSERIGSARLVTGDTGFVVFGSLARGEWTAGSDVDWALLIDGPADDAHLTSTHEIRRILEDLGPEESNRDSLFAETRDIGDRFQKGLTGLFFDTNDDLRVVTQRYGVF